jgi:molybdopterin synthase sulfur carrier subunit
VARLRIGRVIGRYNDSMARVFIPPQMRDVTGGQETVEVSGATVGQIVEQLEARFPGMKGRLCQGKDLKPGLAAIVDGQVARWGLREKVGEESEVHFLPAIGGG